ncbi:hypothetical protein QQS21_006905 [Conoideocrella luteorostrata]|uniref:DUF4385 domain-containing protein n=1 Tax=Conoideocrella luteorostrata TaxID=1105319 RepID=A0AAJ0CPE9_9HYPO|nr:hypothetical protein QQS21_006905 [Conoideocrella luteorostrata]
MPAISNEEKEVTLSTLNVPDTERKPYRIGRGEQGVLTYEPYKSILLPLWRFRTVPLARQSAANLWTRFGQFHEEGDFVGMDMTRKFIQMGMTRAKRYANHAGGRKFRVSATREEIPKSEAHKGKEEKEQASQIFREYWERCRAHEGYQEMKRAFLQEQKRDRSRRSAQ